MANLYDSRQMREVGQGLHIARGEDPDGAPKASHGPAGEVNSSLTQDQTPTAAVIPLSGGASAVPRRAAPVRVMPHEGKRTEVDDWTEPPVPLDGAGVRPWPSGVLRGVPARMVDTLAVSKQVPTDAAAMMLLGVASVAVGGRFVIAPRPADPSWCEPVHLYVVVALPSAERKTGLFQPLAAPLYAWERRECAAREECVATTASVYRAAQKAREKAENALSAAMASGDETVRGEATETLKRCVRDEQQAAREVVRSPRLVTNDATPEALVSLLCEQRGRMALLTDEGGSVFEMMAGRYTDAPNLDPYLKGHDGGTIRVDRKGRAAEHVARATLTIAMATQPSTLAKLAAKPEVSGRGLLARILYSVPPGKAGLRDTEPPPLDNGAVAAWNELVDELLNISLDIDAEGVDQPHTLRFADDAAKAFAVWRAAMEPTLAPGQAFGDNDRLREWGGKLAGAIARVAALLHVMEHPRDWRASIDLDTTERAIGLAGYLCNHAAAAFGVMGDTPGLVAARKLLTWLQKHNRETFTVRDALRALNRNGNRADVVDPALAVLLAHGWIREPTEEKRGPGRPSERYLVHPHAHRAP